MLLLLLLLLPAQPHLSGSCACCVKGHHTVDEARAAAERSHAMC
jgi:hypothetical protein